MFLWNLCQQPRPACKVNQPYLNYMIKKLKAYIQKSKEHKRKFKNYEMGIKGWHPFYHVHYSLKNGEITLSKKSDSDKNPHSHCPYWYLNHSVVFEHTKHFSHLLEQCFTVEQSNYLNIFNYLVYNRMSSPSNNILFYKIFFENFMQRQPEFEPLLKDYHYYPFLSLLTLLIAIFL